MEKHRCKLCHRNFANGRALGGHMRSHVMNLHASSKAKQDFIEEHDQLFMSEEIESVPSSSSSSEDEEEQEEGNGDKGLFSYGMSTNHRNLKKRGGGGGTVDSDQFCFGGAEAAGSVVLQDRESETESSKNPIRRRSRRVRKSGISDAIQFSDYTSIEELPKEKKPKSEKQGIIHPELVTSLEAEPVSSISDTTTEEDVAHCLMMLSRDKWLRRDSEEEQEENFYAEEEEADEEEQENETEKTTKSKKHYSHDFGVVKVTKSRSRGKYRCETCNKVFRSYQALGGHRASHKRIKVQNSNSTEGGMMEQQTGNVAAAVSSVVEEKIHECPVCYRVFSSGQALGGHKRSHVMGAAATHQHLSATIPTPKPFSRFGETFIDLNLPAPVDDDDVSQIELSAVSDAEFVNPLKH